MRITPDKSHMAPLERERILGTEGGELEGRAVSAARPFVLSSRLAAAAASAQEEHKSTLQQRAATLEQLIEELRRQLESASGDRVVELEERIATKQRDLDDLRAPESGSPAHRHASQRAAQKPREATKETRTAAEARSNPEAAEHRRAGNAPARTAKDGLRNSPKKVRCRDLPRKYFRTS